MTDKIRNSNSTISIVIGIVLVFAGVFSSALGGLAVIGRLLAILGLSLVFISIHKLIVDWR